MTVKSVGCKLIKDKNQNLYFLTNLLSISYNHPYKLQWSFWETRHWWNFWN